MRGIRRRLVGSYLVIILLTVFLFELLMFIAVRHYYFGNIRESLQGAADASTAFYTKYVSSGGQLHEQAVELIDTFRTITSAQVQILDSTGRVIADSTGTDFGKTLDTPDVEAAALSGKTGEWGGTLSETGEPILAITRPIQSDPQTTGVLRIVTSLVEVNTVMQNILVFLLFTGLLILLVSLAVSLMLSRTITVPIRHITKGAQEMAAGNFSIRIPRQHDDELGILNDTLHYMADEIIQHEKMKSAFIASVSHELRTPLTSIKGWTITLLHGPLMDHEVRKGLAIIDKETDRLITMVEELLDFSRLGAGKLQLHPTSIPLRDWLHAIIKQVSPRATQEMVSLDMQIDPALEHFSGDPDRLTQVMLNVLDNALKFTPPGGTIEIRAALYEETLVLCVQDNGAGIAAEHLPYVTQKFYKANPTSKGSGIGLAICQEIIALHGGQLTISSTVEAGTKVEILLPISLSRKKDDSIHV